jgi:heme/copper-type cytochrome/quinol oxidase subunit 1
MTLNAPTQIVFIIAVVIAIIAVLGALVAIPFVSAYAFWILVLGFIVLAGGVLMKGA